MQYKIIHFLNYKILREKNSLPTRISGYLHKKYKKFPKYIRLFEKEVNENFKNTKVKILGLGMGIGMISHLNPNYEVSYIEPNKELIKIIKEKFNLPKKTNIENTTAKEYLDKNHKEKYDVIFYDIFVKNKMHWNELNPKYINKIKNNLKEKGLLIVNIAGKKKEIEKKLSFVNYKIKSQFKNPLYKNISQNYIVTIKN